MNIFIRWPSCRISYLLLSTVQSPSIWLQQSCCCAGLVVSVICTFGNLLLPSGSASTVFPFYQAFQNSVEEFSVSFGLLRRFGLTAILWSTLVVHHPVAQGHLFSPSSPSHHVSVVSSRRVRLTLFFLLRPSEFVSLSKYTCLSWKMKELWSYKWCDLNITYRF